MLLSKGGLQLTHVLASLAYGYRGVVWDPPIWRTQDNRVSKKYNYGHE